MGPRACYRPRLSDGRKRLSPPRAVKNWKLLEPAEREGDRARLISVTNQKGGVGKTTTSINLAAALALSGRRVLLVDVDPQSNATTGVGLDYRSGLPSSYELVAGRAELNDVVRPTAISGLDCVPGSLDLAGAEIELVAHEQRERKLAEGLATAHGRYDHVFIDCPPALGLLTLNALTAARELIVPVQCEYYALEGLGQLLETAERVRRTLNPALRVAGFLMTMYDARTRLSSQVASEVRSHFGELVYRTVIPRSVRLSEAPSFGEPVLTLDPSSRGSIAYRILAAELEERRASQAPAPRAAPGPAPRRAPAPVPGPGGRG